MLSQTPKAVQVVGCNTRLRVSMLGIGQRKQNTSLDKLRSSWWTLPSSEKVRVNLRVFVNLHLLNSMLAIDVISSKKTNTCHLEGVELLLDLLCQHGSQSVAGGDFTTTIVLLAGPSIMENDARRECRIALGRWSVRGALAVLSESQSRHEIVFGADSNRSSASMRIIVGSARSARIGRIIDSR